VPGENERCRARTVVRSVRCSIVLQIEGNGRPLSLTPTLLRLEHVAVQERRDTQVRDVDKLRDIEIDRHSGQHVNLLAGEFLRFDQEVDHVEGGVPRRQAYVLGEIGERSVFWPPR
jgi:type II secretory pathway component PulL